MKKNSNKKVFCCLSTLKCEINSYLASTICTFLKKNNYFLTKVSSQADYIIINTCAVDQTRENIALSLTQHYLNKYYLKKQIVIFGCLPKINLSLNQSKDTLKNIILIGPKELHRFNNVFSAEVPIEKINNNLICKNFCNKYGFKDDSYSILISQGCVNNCAYCAIKKAKGDVTSKPLEKIIEEFKRGLKSGFKHFILLGDDCGSYGIDIGTDLAELLNTIAEIKGDYRIDIHYFEPHRLEILFPKINKAIFKKIYAIRIPIQSTSQRIIRLMNRKYNPENIFCIAEKIKRLAPSIILRTHLIYCYPTETREEFINNINHPGLEKFDQIHYYYYSFREGTATERLKITIDRRETKYRIETIKELSRKIKKCVFPYGDEIEIEGFNFCKPLHI